MESKKNQRRVTSLSDFGKIPPQAVEIEEAVLSTLIREDGKEVNKALIFLKFDDFYKESHRLIFKAIKQLSIDGNPVDYLTVVEQLKKTGELDAVGGAYAIVSMDSSMIGSLHLDYHTKILRQKMLQRSVIEFSHELMNDGFDESVDPFDLIAKAQNKFGNLLDMSIKENSIVNSKQIAVNFFKESEEDEGKDNVLLTGHERFDKIIGIVRNKIVLVGGGAKDGKSRFIGHLMFKILEQHENVAINWVTLEDDGNDVLCNYLSSKILMQSKMIKRRTFPEETYKIIQPHVEKFNSYDIEFIEQAMKSHEITAYFENFCRVRKDKFPILIIDNILSLGDREEFKKDLNSMYDYIMGEMLKARQRTKGLIFIIHHFNDAQQDVSRLESAYRPRLGDLKGTESFRRVPNQVLLLNNPAKRKDLVLKYPGKEEELKHIFICDTGANRDDKSEDDEALIRFLHSLDFNIFEEL